MKKVPLLYLSPKTLIVKKRIALAILFFVVCNMFSRSRGLAVIQREQKLLPYKRILEISFLISVVELFQYIDLTLSP